MQLCICNSLSFNARSSLDSYKLLHGRQTSTGGLRRYKQFYESNLRKKDGVRNEEIRQPPENIQHRRYRKQIGEYHSLPRFGRPHKRNSPEKGAARRRQGRKRLTLRI